MRCPNISFCLFFIFVRVGFSFSISLSLSYVRSFLPVAPKELEKPKPALTKRWSHWTCTQYCTQPKYEDKFCKLVFGHPIHNYGTVLNRHWSIQLIYEHLNEMFYVKIINHLWASTEHMKLSFAACLVNYSGYFARWINVVAPLSANLNLFYIHSVAP